MKRSDTIELWEDSTFKLETWLFDIFSNAERLRVYRIASSVNNAHHLYGNRSRLMPFPENHWVVSFMVYAFHPTAFLQFSVFELVTRISRNWQTGHLFTLRNTKEFDRNSGESSWLKVTCDKAHQGTLDTLRHERYFGDCESRSSVKIERNR